MNKAKELATRIEDLEGAIKAVGQLLVDEKRPVKQRIDMALGILFQYDAAAQPNGKADA